MIALYRKYRPQTFSQVIGQSSTVDVLSKSIITNQVVHAYLFSGPRGTGKTTLARIFAKALNCEARTSEQYEPCNICSTCKAINESSYIDFVEIDAASNRGIDDMRELKEAVRFAPLRKDAYKIYIIDEAHMLTKEASNALLKTLEEPPKNVIFILATTDPHKLLPTILSRVQRFSFSSLSALELKQKLELICTGEQVTVEPEVIQRIIELSMGGARDAESLLGKLLSSGISKITSELADGLLGKNPYQSVYQILEEIGHSDIPAALRQLHHLYQAGYSLDEFTQALAQKLRLVFLGSIDPSLVPDKDLLPDEKTRILTLASLHPTDVWGNLLDSLERRKSQIHTAYLPHLPLELAIVESCLSTPHVPTQASLPPVNPRPARNTESPRLQDQSSQSTPSRPNLSQNPFTKKVRSPEKAQETLNPTPRVEDSAPNELSLYVIQSDFPKIIKKLGEKNKSLLPLMRHLKPISFSEMVLVCEIKSDFFRSRIEKLQPEIVAIMQDHWSTPSLILHLSKPELATSETASSYTDVSSSPDTSAPPKKVSETPKPLASAIDDIFGDNLI